MRCGGIRLTFRHAAASNAAGRNGASRAWPKDRKFDGLSGRNRGQPDGVSRGHRRVKRLRRWTSRVIATSPRQAPSRPSCKVAGGGGETARETQKMRANSPAFPANILRTLSNTVRHLFRQAGLIRRRATYSLPALRPRRRPHVSQRPYRAGSPRPLVTGQRNA